MWRNSNELLDYASLKVEESISNGTCKVEILLTDSIEFNQNSLKKFFIKKIKLCECAKWLKARFIDYVISSRVEFKENTGDITKSVFWKLNIKERP